MVRTHGSKQQTWWQEQEAEISHILPQAGSRERPGSVVQLWTLNTSPQVILLARPYLLDLSKQLHPLRTKYPND